MASLASRLFRRRRPRGRPHDPGLYDQDGLRTAHDHDFVTDTRFRAAYARGLQAGAGVDNRIHWRVHVALWAARNAVHLPGDFVECGVNAGVVSSAICHDLEWNARDKTFWLVDTFAGPVEELYSEQERREGKVAHFQEVLACGGYVCDVERARANFAEWPRARVVQGVVPDCLASLDVGPVAFVHVDMNCAAPEVAASEHFWPRLVPGGFLLYDDYAYHGYREQKLALDEFALRKGVDILALPTGQGLVVKPAGD